MLGLGGALTKVFGGQEYNAGGIKKTESTGSNDSGPTSIQIQMEKNSDDSDDEEEEGKKQVRKSSRQYLVRPFGLC